MADLKKTLQKEFHSAKSFEAEKERNGNCIAAKSPNTANVFAASVTVSNDTLACDQCGTTAATTSSVVMDEVNFKYLKHVIVKFLTSREVSAT